jgi:hypothetical protein
MNNHDAISILEDAIDYIMLQEDIDYHARCIIDRCIILLYRDIISELNETIFELSQGN